MAAWHRAHLIVYLILSVVILVAACARPPEITVAIVHSSAYVLVALGPFILVGALKTNTAPARSRKPAQNETLTPITIAVIVGAYVMLALVIYMIAF